FCCHERRAVARGVAWSGALAGRLMVLRGSNGKHRPLCGGLMGHATPGRTGSARATPSTGHAASAGGSADVRRCAAGAGVGEFGVAVVADLSARGAARPAAHADPRTTAAVVRGSAAHARADPGTGPAPSGLPHGFLDPRASGQGDPAAVRDSASPKPRLETADHSRLAVSAVRDVRGGEADANAHAGAGAAPGGPHPGPLDFRTGG